IVGTALFSDGIACTVLRCEDRPGTATIEDWAMHQVFETTGLLGYQLTDTGLRMNLDARLPDVIGENLRSATAGMLGRNSLGLEDIEHFVVHPGGVKILDRIEETLKTFGGNVDLARNVMSRYGNMSSSTVVFILDALLKSTPSPGPTLMMSFGPGFSAHQLLIRLSRGDSQ
ncbi:MAG: 3-oxoacyl-[acyl-carrier-protein] synthase III C-terminal domain-containing protein, partial [Phycisphaerales bacterium JB064]